MIEKSDVATQVLSLVCVVFSESGITCAGLVPTNQTTKNATIGHRMFPVLTVRNAARISWLLSFEFLEQLN